MKLAQKVAIVTGGASGIGKAIALAFAQERGSVYIIDSNKELGVAVIREFDQLGYVVNFLHADVASSLDAENVFEVIMQQHGRINILVNNAGMAYKATIDQLSEQQWDHQIDVNLKSVYLYCHRAIPIMAKQGGGAIINMGSVTSLVGVPDFAAYVASKTGMLGLTRAMALDHAHQNIRVNIVCPSGVKTPLMDWQFSIAQDPQAEIKRVLDLHPIGRMASPEEIADFIVYLASDKATYITGSAFAFDGGYTAR